MLFLCFLVNSNAIFVYPGDGEHQEDCVQSQERESFPRYHWSPRSLAHPVTISGMLGLLIEIQGNLNSQLGTLKLKGLDP